jgi:hypothetical protein
MAVMDTGYELLTLRAELDELRGQVKRLSLELAETRAFFREKTAELGQQVKEAKTAALLGTGRAGTPPLLLPQR